MERVIMSRDFAIEDDNIYLYSPEEKMFFYMNKDDMRMSSLLLGNHQEFNDLDLCVFYNNKIYANEINGRNLIEYNPLDGNYTKHIINFDEYEGL